MPTVNQAERISDPEPRARSLEDAHGPTQRKLRVYMMDLWSFIPYYMAGLCSSLASENVEVTLGSVRYHLDRDYFQKSDLARDGFLLDAGGAVGPAKVRRVLKSCEYVANLLMLGLRFMLREPDILHVQYLPFLERGFRFELWFLSWAKRLGIPIVYTVHNVTRQDAPDQGRTTFARAYRLADALICHGEAARTELERDFKIAPDKIWVIPHGPLFDDAPKLTPHDARLKLGLPFDEPMALCLGVISEYKGIPFLLDAWKKLKAANVAGRLLIAGTGDQRILSEIREKVTADGLADSVNLRLEFVPVEELPLLYQAADMLVYPYKAGTTSGALLTGLNYGRAVVATRLPFFLEHLKDGETALLVDYGDTHALAAALQNLIQQPQRRAKLATAVKHEAALEIGWQEIARKTRECYQSVLAR